MRKTHYELYKAKDGTYRWRLVAANNEIVAVSEGYVTMSGAEASALYLKTWAQEAGSDLRYL